MTGLTDEHVHRVIGSADLPSVDTSVVAIRHALRLANLSDDERAAFGPDVKPAEMPRRMIEASA